MQQSKHCHLALLGFTSAAVGVLVAELLPRFSHGLMGELVNMVLWAMIVATGITLGCCVGVEVCQRRRPLRLRTLKRASLAGAGSGVIAAGFALAIYYIHASDISLREVIVSSPCVWAIAIMGLLLGLSVGKLVPNLGWINGALAGIMAGVLGSAVLMLLCSFMPQLLGRMIGIGLLGAALGVFILAIEATFRKAHLEIAWGTRQHRRVSLGPDVVYVGSGPDDEVYAAGAAPREAGFLVKDGQVLQLDPTSGKKTRLADGFHRRIGSIQIMVCEGSPS